MELIQHTVNWSKGEIFEGKLLLIFGLATMAAGFLFWKVGGTPYSRAMLFPLLVAGLLFSGLAAGMWYNNHQRIDRYQADFQKDPAAFVQKEKARTENFIGWYPIVRYVCVGVFLLAMGLYLFWPAPLPRAIALTLLTVAVAVLFVDHFSEERGRAYHAEIIRRLN